MLFKGRAFPTENDCQFETIGVFWDEYAVKYGQENLQGLEYGWTERSIEYVISLIDGGIDGPGCGTDGYGMGYGSGTDSES